MRYKKVRVVETKPHDVNCFHKKNITRDEAKTNRSLQNFGFIFRKFTIVTPHNNYYNDIIEIKM